ncbi:MAG TPA: hypothetical protein VJ742_10150 [Nitrososphaera sp.]|nr:hypothetical protein [Nitrososphaera sp.]
MVDMYGPTPEEMKVGEIYRVVQDGEKLRLEKVDGNTVITMPQNLRKVIAIEAILADMTLEQAIVDDLKDLIKVRLEGDPFYHEWIEQIYNKGEAAALASSS